MIHGLVARQVGISQESHLALEEALVERRCFLRSAVSDDRELGSHRVALVAQVAQLRGFSAAEESPEFT